MVEEAGAEAVTDDTQLSDDEAAALIALIEEAGAPGSRMRVGRPPFGFGLELPPDWKAIRTSEPELSQDVQRICETAPGWRNLRAAEQMSLRRFLTEKAADAAEAGVLVTAVGTGVCDDGQAPTFATLTLAWVQTRPFRADLDLAQLAAGPEEEQTQFETSLGTGVLTSEYNDAGEAGRQRTGSRWRFDVQAFVPVEGTEWMALVTGSAAEKSWEDPMAAAVRRCAASIAVTAQPMSQS